jgi:hypothetical protein
MSACRTAVPHDRTALGEVVVVDGFPGRFRVVGVGADPESGSWAQLRPVDPSSALRVPLTTLRKAPR